MGFVRTKGFTLIELVVVIVLIGILTSFLMLSMNLNSLDSVLDEESRKIHALIKSVKDEAIIQAKEMALVVSNQSYLFRELVVEQDEETGATIKTWELSEDKIFRERKIHEGLKIYLETDSVVSSLEKEEEQEFNQIFFSSSGEQSKFILKLSITDKADRYYIITGKLNGDLLIQKGDDYK